MIHLPRLYPILDHSSLPETKLLIRAAEELAAAGCTLLQYRNKAESASAVWVRAKELRRQLDPSVRLIMNDRADLALAAGFDGVHLGQDDLSPSGARKVIGVDLWLGVSTHTPEQVSGANKTSADYIAIGPVFSTSSKAQPDPVVGLGGVRQARGLTGKPLVAIGGITRRNCRDVLACGADAVALISDLIRDPGKSAEEFLRILG
jgi:thiamine-phosphate pyrophosphorylase